MGSDTVPISTGSSSPRRGVGPAAQILAVLAMALAARISVPMPLSPVPVTGQSLAVLLTGAWLGPGRGVTAVLAYLALGAAGLPVFAGGASGAQRLTGPTGGYLVGFLLAAYVAGRGADRYRSGKPAAWPAGALFASLLLAHAAIFACGVPWLARSTGWPTAIEAGLLPFLAGGLVKALLAALIVQRAFREPPR